MPNPLQLVAPMLNRSSESAVGALPQVPSMTLLVGQFLASGGGGDDGQSGDSGGQPPPNQSQPPPNQSQSPPNQSQSPPNQSQSPPDIDDLARQLSQAIGRHEHAGAAPSPKTYQNVNAIGAIGRYQFMPETLAKDSEKYLGQNVDPAEFRLNPDLQDELMYLKTKDALTQALGRTGGNMDEAMRQVAIIHYHGSLSGDLDKPAVSRATDANGRHIVGESPNSYATNVLDLVDSPPQSGTQTPAPAERGYTAPLSPETISVLKKYGVSIPQAPVAAHPEASNVYGDTYFLQRAVEKTADGSAEPGDLTRAIATNAPAAVAADPIIYPLDNGQETFGGMPVYPGMPGYQKPLAQTLAESREKAGREAFLELKGEGQEDKSYQAEQVKKSAEEAVASIDITNPGTALSGAFEKALGQTEVGRTVLTAANEATNLFGIRRAVDPEFEARQELFSPETETGRIAAQTIGGGARVTAELLGLGVAGRAMQGAEGAPIVGKVLGYAAKLLTGDNALGTATALSQIAPLVEGDESLKQAAVATAINYALGPALGAVGEASAGAAAESGVPERVVRGIGYGAVGAASSVAQSAANKQAPNPVDIAASAVGLGAFGLIAPNMRAQEPVTAQEPVATPASPILDGTPHVAMTPGKYVTEAPTVEHTIENGARAGQSNLGVVATDLTREQARAIDPYAFKKDDGFFIEQRHVARPEQPIADAQQAAAISNPVEEIPLPATSAPIQNEHATNQIAVEESPGTEHPDGGAGGETTQTGNSDRTVGTKPGAGQEAADQKEVTLYDARRAAGEFAKDGTTYTRQAPVDIIEGRPVSVRFAWDKEIPVRYALMEADDLQPSHRSGRENPENFIPEAQPKNRTQSESGGIRPQDIANGLVPEEITMGATAYSGAPVVNVRGEVFQGTGRGDGLRTYYDSSPDDPRGYTDFLKDQSSYFGFTPEDVDSFNKPVLVRMADVTDREAIDLGQYRAVDMETPESRADRGKQLAGRIEPAAIDAISDIFDSAGLKSDASFSDVMRASGSDVLDVMVDHGAVTPDIAETYTNARGELTPEGMDAVKNGLVSTLFKSGDVNARNYYETIVPHNFKEAVARNIPQLLKSDYFPDVLQRSTMAYADWKKSGLDSFDQWRNQSDSWNGLPEDRYGIDAVALASQMPGTQKSISLGLQSFRRLEQGAPADLISEEVPPVDGRVALSRAFALPMGQRPTGAGYLGMGFGSLQPALEKAGEAMGEFASEDLLPAAKRVRAAIGEAAESTKATLAPSSGPRAEVMALGLRKGGSELSRSMDILNHSLDPSRKLFQSMTKEQNWDFMARLMEGRPLDSDNPQLEDARQALQLATRDAHNRLFESDQSTQDVYGPETGVGSMMINYFPNNFKEGGVDAARAKNFVTGYLQKFGQLPGLLKARAHDVYFTDPILNRMHAEYEAKATKLGPDHPDTESARLNYEAVKSSVETFGRRVDKPFLAHLASGQVPISDNPVDLVVAHMAQTMSYIMEKQAVADAVRNGAAVNSTEDVPGMRQINGAIGQAQLKTMQTDAFGTEQWSPSRIYAPPEVARVINNFTSSGLEKYALWRGYRAVRNTLNMAELSLSYLHAMTTSMYAVASKLSGGVVRLVDGTMDFDAKRLAGGLSDIATSPAAPLTMISDGGKMLDEWMNPGKRTAELGQKLTAAQTSGADTAPIASALANAQRIERLTNLVAVGGGRAWLNPEFDTRLIDGFRMAVSKSLSGENPIGNAIRAVWRGPLAAVEASAIPIMRWWVPRMKMGLGAYIMERALEKLPVDAPELDVARAVSTAVNSVDNRLGQVIYDNWFWNKVHKDVLFGLIGRPGWTVGTLKEFGAGIGDVLGLTSAVKGEGFKPQFTDRAAFSLVGLPVTIGVTNTLMQYALTGKLPSQTGTPIEDMLLGARTGELDKRGNPRRVSPINYVRDMYSLGTDLDRTVQTGDYSMPTVAGKMTPNIGLLANLASNKDYWDAQIHNAGAPLYDIEARLQDAEFVGTHYLTPYSIQNVEQMSQTKNGPGWMSFLGITPVSQRLTMTAAEAEQLRISKSKRGEHTLQEEKKAEAELDVERAYSEGGMNEATARAATHTDVLAPKDLRDLAKRMTGAPKGPPEMPDYVHNTPTEALRIYSLANDRERQSLDPFLDKIMARATPGNTPQETLDRIRSTYSTLTGRQAGRRLPPMIVPGF